VGARQTRRKLATKRHKWVALNVCGKTADDVQQRAGRDRVGSPVAQRRVQIMQIRFVKEGDQKQNRRSEDEQRSQQLHRPSPGLDSISEVSADSEIEQCSQQYEDMSRAIQQSRSIGHAMQMIVELVHVLARQQERNQHEYSEYEMNSLHLFIELRNTDAGAAAFEQ
jgi:hypothetical protein